MLALKAQPKKRIPPPGRRLSLQEALKKANEKFGPALAKLAK